MVRVKSTPKKVDLAKLQAKKEAKKESGKKKGPKQATLKTFFKVDYRYSRPDPKVILPKTKSTKQPTPEEAKAAEMQRRREADDLRLVESIFPGEAENRLARDNSEEALTWNVMRFLEKSGLLGEILSTIHGEPLADVQAFYWAHSPAEGGAWSELKAAMEDFGEKKAGAAPPQVVARSDQALFFIAARFTRASVNGTTESLIALSCSSAVSGRSTELCSSSVVIAWNCIPVFFTNP